MEQLVFALVEPASEADWQTHLTRFTGGTAVHGLDDPVEVAHRLQRILTRRPRLAFSPCQVPRLVDVLARRLPAVADGAHSLVAELATRLR